MNSEYVRAGQYRVGRRFVDPHALNIHAPFRVNSSEYSEAAEALRERNQSPMADYERVEYDPVVAQVRSMLAEEQFRWLWDEGRAMRMEQAIELAIEAHHDPASPDTRIS